jgi:DNA polymerase-3 subunit delta'
MISQSNFPHTSLITGRKGVPLWPVLHRAIKALMNKDVKDTHGVSAAIQKVDKMIHPDVHYTFPYPKKKDNTCGDYMQEFRAWALGRPFPSVEEWRLYLSKQSSSFGIHAAECQRIMVNLGLKSFEDGPKIAVIWGAEELGNNGNRLLKLLEEPPEDTFIFLVTDQPQALLTTITSRCQIFRLDPINQEEMSGWLAERYELDHQQALAQAQRAEGNINVAIDLVEHGVHELAMKPEDWLLALVRSDFEGILAMADQLRSMPKEEQRLFCLEGLRKVRDWYFFPEADKRIFEQVEKNLFDLEFVEEWSKLLNEVLTGIERNAHVAMLFTAKSVAFWKWMKARG